MAGIARFSLASTCVVVGGNPNTACLVDNAFSSPTFNTCVTNVEKIAAGGVEITTGLQCCKRALFLEWENGVAVCFCVRENDILLRVVPCFLFCTSAVVLVA